MMIQFREKIKTAMIDFETPPLWLQSFLTPQQVYHLISMKCKYGPIESSNHVSGGQKDKWLILILHLQIITTAEALPGQQISFGKNLAWTTN